MLPISFANPTTNLAIDAGDGDDTVIVGALDAGLTADVTLEGGGGTDTLAGPADDTTWTVDGDGAGDVAGVSFTGMENLAGAADNEDTFVFAATGSLAGEIEGGDRGFDSLMLEGHFDTLIYTATGPHSGSVDRDGDVIVYDGLEPINDGSADDIIFNIGAAVGTITLSDDDTANDDVSRIDAPGIETVDFTNPTGSLTINLSSGADTIEVQVLDAQFDADLTIDAGNDNDAITVAAITGSGAYAIDGGAGSGDQISVTDNSDMTLTDAALASGLGSQNLDLTSIEQAVLTGGGGANDLDASGFSGSASLNGGGGGDTLTGGSGANTLTGGGGADDYIFTGTFGADVVVDSGGNLDFSDFTDGNNAPTTTTRFDVGFDSGDVVIAVFDGGSQGTVTLDNGVSFGGGGFTSAVEVDDNIDLDHLTAGMTWLAALVDRIGASDPRLNVEIPILGDRSLGELFDLGGFFDTTFVDPAATLAAGTTLHELFDAFNSVAGVMTSISMDDEKIDLAVELDADVNLADVEITLGETIEEFLIAENAVGDLVLAVDWSFTATVDSSEGNDAVDTVAFDFTAGPDPDLTVGAQIAESDISFRARAGALALDIGPSTTSPFPTSKVLLEGETSGTALGYRIETSALGATASRAVLTSTDIAGLTQLDGSAEANVTLELYGD